MLLVFHCIRSFFFSIIIIKPSSHHAIEHDVGVLMEMREMRDGWNSASNKQIVYPFFIAPLCQPSRWLVKLTVVKPLHPANVLQANVHLVHSHENSPLVTN